MDSINNFAVDPSIKLALQRVGVDIHIVLRLARLPKDLFERKEAMISASEYFALWEAIETESNNSCIALEMIEGMSADIFDPVLFAAFCSPDLNTALERVKEFKPLIGQLRLNLTRTNEHTSAEIDFSAVPLSPPISLVAVELAFFVRFARLATGIRMKPLVVTSPIDFPDKKKFENFFGVRPKRSKLTELKFSAEDARRPFVFTNPRMWDFFEPGLKERLSDHNSRATIEERVRSVLARLLPSGEFSVRDTAIHLSMSTRTLQRHLKAEGTSYQSILDTLREELAVHYLRNSSIAINQIFLLLGFKDPSSFYRAFQAWRGLTPEAVRSGERS